MTVEIWGEVVRKDPSSKNKANTKIYYEIRFYKKDTPTSPARRIHRNKPVIFTNVNVGKYTWELHVEDVKDLVEGSLLSKTESISWQDPGGPIVYEDMDFCQISFETSKPGYYVPQFNFYITDTDGETVIGYGQSKNPGVIPTTVSNTFTGIKPYYFKVPEDLTWSVIDASKSPYKYQTEIIPTMIITKAPVVPDMPAMLKGINIDTDQSGIEKKAGGFQYDSCRKRWITIWVRHRYVNPKTHVVADKNQTASIDAGQGPKGFNKQYTYEIEGILDSVARDKNNSQYSFSQLSKMGKTLHNLNTNSINKWDWASNNMPYDPPGTGTSMGSWKTATETAYKSFINGNCEELPPSGNNNSSTTPDTPIDIDKLIARFNPPPHITTRHFSPIADPERKVFE